MNSTQTQTTSATILAFIAGYLSSRFTFFDTATWLAIVTGAAGLGVTIWTAIATSKKSIVNQALSSDKATLVNSVAALPEVKEISLDKNVSGTPALNHATADNVVLK